MELVSPIEKIKNRWKILIQKFPAPKTDVNPKIYRVIIQYTRRQFYYIKFLSAKSLAEPTLSN